LATIVVFAGTLAVSVAAFASPSLLHLFVRDLPQMRGGQWWRLLTPILVQPSGWGQLVFNMVGVGVVGAALQHHLRWPSWAVLYVVGGVVSNAVYGAWHPADTGGGSSAAVAALIGTFAVLHAASSEPRGLPWWAQLYAVFFAVYLTALDVGGVVPSIIAGNATLLLMFVARKAVSSVLATRVSLAVVAAAGIVMTVVQDDHGVGIVIGVLAGCLAARLPSRRRPSWPRRNLRVSPQEGDQPGHQ
jgi:membrane associated rhomboid family serine protease